MMYLEYIYSSPTNFIFQVGYSSPTQDAIRKDLSLSLAEVSQKLFKI